MLRSLGLEREPSRRFAALCSHYLFEPCFARTSEGHDKGRVEARGENVRLQHLTPIPSGQSLGGDRGGADAGPGRGGRAAT